MNNNARPETLPNWYAVYTRPKQEFRAESNLKAWGIETLNPCARAKSRRLEKTRRVVKQLFPRYLFARFPSEALHKITFTRGVQTVVSFGNKPAAVDDAVISLIKSRIGEDGFVRFNDELTAGDRVMIIAGPFASLEGIFDRTLNDSERVSLMLSTVALQSRLIIERDYVVKLDQTEVARSARAG
ncbi:MAG TPA: transcription termination/antitermination NusG family protein [Pyrinomonadaceae bacterium]|nr:transcription termination/antitermination NusG family protein [Pyrinomonadaceae bacterium]